MNTQTQTETGEGNAPRATNWIREMAQMISDQAPSNADLKELGEVLSDIAEQNESEAE